MNSLKIALLVFFYVDRWTLLLSFVIQEDFSIASEHILNQVVFKDSSKQSRSWIKKKLADSLSSGAWNYIPHQLNTIPPPPHSLGDVALRTVPL